jgi:hypothetical protein
MNAAHNAFPGELLQRLRMAFHDGRCLIAVKQSFGDERSSRGRRFLWRCGLMIVVRKLRRHWNLTSSQDCAALNASTKLILSDERSLSKTARRFLRSPILPTNTAQSFTYGTQRDRHQKVPSYLAKFSGTRKFLIDSRGTREND